MNFSRNLSAIFFPLCYAHVSDHGGWLMSLALRLGERETSPV
jgi:hypothetical protein